jgi:hypothetical protein
MLFAGGGGGGSYQWLAQVQELRRLYPEVDVNGKNKLGCLCLSLYSLHAYGRSVSLAPSVPP